MGEYIGIKSAIMTCINQSVVPCSKVFRLHFASSIATTESNSHAYQDFLLQ